MQKEKIVELVNEVFREDFEMEPQQLVPEAHLFTELGLDSLDVVVLGGTEVDTHFNVNVNTHSDGRLLHGIGGHQDTAAASKITVVALPIYRKKNPVVRERVTTITTPGNVVDVIITDVGVAVNPARKDIMERLKGKMNIIGKH